ncbi:putative O-glycosylation ligase, exosortase A system-associated [Herbaspirillum robiniae]|uniref:putative O-glycosylation ligase, exosortase A system-associated n=1 Tax=Herbaspirillum robiniae TaxID=2014887 RepID=UPI003D774C76
MRDYLVFAMVMATLPYILKRPAAGVMAYVWLSLMNPHRLTYGFAYDFPFAALVAGTTLVSLMLSKQPKRFPLQSTTVVLMMFIFWITFTCFFALQPKLVWGEWNTVIKTMFMVLVSMAALNTERDARDFAWVIGLSLGFWGVKGGVFTLLSGGGDHVYGPPDSFIADNNDLALALLTVLPLLWGLHMQATRRWVRLAMLAVCILTVVSVVGSYSRGALLGGGVMLTMLWLKSRKKLTTGLIVLLLIPLVYTVMPDQWFARMSTIDSYNKDASALGRINAWHFAVNVATHHVLGGGFKVFSPEIFYLYAPNPLDFHVAHSIYFQALGEQGPVGLLLFLVLMWCTWRCGGRIIRYCKGRPELKWAGDLAAMAQVSVVGYAVGGAFLSLTYFDLYYYIIVLLVVLEKCVVKAGPSPYAAMAPRTYEAHEPHQAPAADAAPERRP